jgi:hypothetical protein
MSQPALMSVSTLANDGYTTVFLPGNDGVNVFHANDVVISSTAPPALQGWRDGRGLWMVPVVDDTAISPGLDVAETAMGVYELPSTKEVMRFLHATLGNPTQATLLTAAQHGNLVTFPGMTPKNISRHFPESDETQQGHMNQTKQGVRSTKIVDEDAILGVKRQPGVKHKDVYLIVFDATKKSMFSDQTGKFPITSARGNKYIMVAVELDGNYIDGELLQSRSAKSLTKAYQTIFQRWKATGVICPNWHILDNEAPEELKQAIRDNRCRVELTPADQHRRNAAEQVIQTFKGHFISVLAGVADSFPINQWDELLPQTILTMNLLRQSNVASNISAWAYHHGSFDYNRMPLAPMGCAVQFHIKPSRRKTFGEHSEDGFYLKTSEEHYRTHVVFCKKTRAKRLADTVFFKHKYITQPMVMPADAIVNALTKLQDAIQGIQHSKNDAHFEALRRLEQTLQPQNKQIIKTGEQVKLPRVEQQIELTQQIPTVRFDDSPPTVHNPLPRLIVASPQKPFVERQIVEPPPKPILKPPTYIDESIAARVRARRLQSKTTVNETIAGRVAQRRREAAHAILDQETGELLEYRRLLKHPRFKRLAQGIGGRIKGTNTMQFVHKKTFHLTD